MIESAVTVSPTAPSATSDPVVASFPATATIKAVEDTINSTYASRYGHVPNLELDFSNSTFIEIASLQHIIALVACRKQHGLQTRLRLPAGEAGFRARSILRKWGYPAALRQATGLRFEHFVVESDLEYFRGKGGDQANTPYLGAQITYDFPSGPVSFTAEAHRFFEFVTWSIEKYNDPKRLVIDAYDAWNVAPVMSVLNRQLRRPRNPSLALAGAGAGQPDVYVTSRVFYEAMTNAVRHPGARVI
ncbi:MAG: hypothetical protein ACREXR_24075, partial [Gammaproteobacteria bacterium]